MLLYQKRGSDYYRVYARRQGTGDQEDQEESQGFSDTMGDARGYIIPAASGLVYAGAPGVCSRLVVSSVSKKLVDSDCSFGYYTRLLGLNTGETKWLYASVYNNGTVNRIRVLEQGNTTDLIQADDSLNLTLVRPNRRGGLYALDTKSGSLYRWSPGDTEWTRLAKVASLTTADGLPLDANDIQDMQADAKGNIVLLDKGNNAVRYIQIFP